MREDAVTLASTSLQARADILNPDTPLAFLSLRAADAHQVLRDIWVAAAGASVWTWDMLGSLNEEHQLFTKFSFSIAEVFYVLSRISTAACMYVALAFVVAPVDNCNALVKPAAALFALAPILGSFLMLLRVRAVYIDHPPLARVFSVFWLLCGLATIGTTVPSLHATHIGTTRACIVDEADSTAGIGIIVCAVFDTVFFLALSYRLLLMHQYGETWKTRLRTFFGGRAPHLSGVRRRGLTHALLRAGQQYYLLTMWMSIAAAIVPFLRHVPLDLRIVLCAPHAALQNIMMCRVHRQLKLGLIVDYDLNFPAGSSVPASPPARARQGSCAGMGDIEAGRRPREASDATSNTVMES